MRIFRDSKRDSSAKKACPRGAAIKLAKRKKGEKKKKSEEAGGRATFRMTRLLGVAEIIDEPVTRTGATRGLNNVFQPLKSS